MHAGRMSCIWSRLNQAEKVHCVLANVESAVHEKEAVNLITMPSCMGSACTCQNVYHIRAACLTQSVHVLHVKSIGNFRMRVCACLRRQAGKGLRYRARTVYPGALILGNIGKSSGKIFAGRGQIRMSRHELPGPLNI
jgi:hypothetical protein